MKVNDHLLGLSKNMSEFKPEQGSHPLDATLRLFGKTTFALTEAILETNKALAKITLILGELGIDEPCPDPAESPFEELK